MRIIISGKGMDLTEALKEQVEAKMKKLDKYFISTTVATATMKTEKNSHIIEITIPVKGNVLRVQRCTDDMYKSIDDAIDILERQIRKYRTKFRDNKIHNLMRKEAEGDFSYDEEIEEIVDDIRIVKKKHFVVKPMDPVEACMQSELIDHDFFLFKNSETGNICAVYKRADGAFGLLEPEEE